MPTTTTTLGWFTSADATARIFIASAPTDAALCDACLTRLTGLMLLSWVGHISTLVTPCVSGIASHWYWHGQMPWDWSETGAGWRAWQEHVPTLAFAAAVVLLNLVVWPTPNVQQRVHDRHGFTEAVARACIAHGKHADAQYGCLLQLGAALSGKHGGGAEQVRQAGGVEAACAALRANATHAGIRLEGLSLLANLSYQSQESAAAAVTHGAAAAIVGTLAAADAEEEAAPPSADAQASASRHASGGGWQAQAAIALANLTKGPEAARALQEALRAVPPGGHARVRGAFDHHPAPTQGEAMRQLVDALVAINRSGAQPRADDGYEPQWTAGVELRPPE